MKDLPPPNNEFVVRSQLEMMNHLPTKPFMEKPIRDDVPPPSK